MVKQFNVVPDRAATVVVHPTPGVGDTTSIADALAMLSAIGAGGGAVFLREGTYSLASTVTLPDFDVAIIGCGGDTLIDLGSNVIAAFTIPDGLTSKHDYRLSNFNVVGNSVSGQKVLAVSDSNARGASYLSGINSTGIQFIIDVTDGDLNWPPDTNAVYVHVEDSWFTPVSDGTGVLCRHSGSPNSQMVFATFTNVNFMVDLSSTVGGNLNDNFAGEMHYSFYDCQLSLTPAQDVWISIHAERTRFWNYSGSVSQIFIIDVFGHYQIKPASAFINCDMNGMNLIVETAVIFDGGVYTNTLLNLANPVVDTTLAPAMVVKGVSFVTSPKVPSGFGPLSDPFSNNITVDAGDEGPVVIDGCTFNGDSTIIESYIRVGYKTTIANCTFFPLFGGTAGISIAGIQVGVSAFSKGWQCIVHHNRFDVIAPSTGWGVPPILEAGAGTNWNYYSDNIIISTRTNIAETPITTLYPVLIGKDSVYNGVRPVELTGVATVSSFPTFTSQFTHTNPKGILGAGTLKNTGGASMRVKETVTDAFGTSDSRTTTVSAGDTMLLNPQSNIGTSFPPYVSYAVAVCDDGVGTTFSIRHATEGAN